MRHRLECEEMRVLLFALLENEVTADEKQDALAHLTACADCRSEMLAEQAMTGLMGGPPERRARSRMRRWLAPLATVVLAGAGLVAAFSILEQPRAYGSIAPSCLSPSMTLADGKIVPLQS